MGDQLIELNLSYRDMHAIKHALQNVVRQKNRRLEHICTEEMAWNYDYELQEEIDRLDKDLIQEESLITLFEKEIEDFKAKYILSNFKKGAVYNAEYTRRFK